MVEAWRSRVIMRASCIIQAVFKNKDSCHSATVIKISETIFVRSSQNSEEFIENFPVEFCLLRVFKF